MSESSSPEPMLARAKEQETAYDWPGAAGSYKKALDSRSEWHPSTLAQIYEQTGYSFYRAAMQAGSTDEFRERIRQAIENYDRAEQTYSTLSEHNTMAMAIRCRATRAYLEYWLRPEASEKKRLVDEAWKLTDKALKEFQTVRDAPEYWRTLERLWITAFLSAYYHSDSTSIEKVNAEVLEHAEQAIELFSTTGTASQLAQAYVMAAGWLDQSSFWVPAPDQQERYRSKARTYWVNGKERSEEAALLQATSWGPLSTFGVGSDESLLILRKIQKYANKSKDRWIIGGLFELLALNVAWKAVGSEDPEEGARLLGEALGYAEQAKQQYSSILFASPGSSVLWAGEPHPEYYYLLARIEPDSQRKRTLLEHGLATVPQMLKAAENSGFPYAISTAQHVASKVLESLAASETGSLARKRLLERALQHRNEAIKISERISPHAFWDLGVFQNYLANIKYELARLEEKSEEKKKLLEDAVLTKETCLKLGIKVMPWIEKSPSQIAWIGERQIELGDQLNSLHDLTHDQEHLKRAAQAFGHAIELFQKSDQSSRVAECHWRVAEAHDALGEHRTAANEFGLASKNFRLAAEKISSLKKLYGEHAIYMDAWSDIENARYHHARQEYEEATKSYGDAAMLHKSTQQWSFLASNYWAWAAVEKAEDLSRREEIDQAVQSFEDGARLFKDGKRSISEELRRIGNPDERHMATNLVKIANLREEYCRARIVLEEAKTLDQKGDHSSSSEKYGQAVEVFEKIAQRLGTDPAEQEFKLIITLSKAWQAMTRAEAEVSPEFYLEASKLFDEAKQLSPTEKSKMLALGHSRFCKALEAGARFTDTREPTLHENAVKNLETAADFYVKAGFPSASEYSHACKLLFDAYLYMDEANKEKDHEKKARLYVMSETVLQGSAESFSKAHHAGKREEVLDLLKKVKEDREIAVSLSEVLHAPSIMSATTSFATPTPTFERPVGLERFQYANVQASIIAHEKSVKIGEDFGVELELVNAGRGPAQLVKVEGIVPEGFELREKPEPFGMEDSYLNMKGKRLDPLKTTEIRLILRPSVQGHFVLKPRIMYLDESGRYKSHEPEPVEVTIREVGLQGLQESERRLAVIMFTDMVGYSALSRKNEALAMDLLEEHRKILRLFFPKHNGTEVKTLGDGFLVEFASALEAVKCAFNLQKSLHDRNMVSPMEKRILVRIGIHLGDVIHDQRDVYGDAVNVASRIEPLADPGGISVSGQVYESVKNALSYRFDNLPLRELSNVDDAITVYRIVVPWGEQYSPISLSGKDFPAH